LRRWGQPHPHGVHAAGSEFVGIDAGARGIAIGKENASAIGLANLHLRHLDMLDTTVELGRFDYIISHGVYSWVPPAVQERLLEIGRGESESAGDRVRQL
jgi:protein-L-isoaspartate O-methyltransferase